MMTATKRTYGHLCLHSVWSWSIMVALWWIGAIIVDNPVSLPTPISTASTLTDLLGTVKFWDHIASSLSDLSLGWISCLTVLVLLSFIMIISKSIQQFLLDISAGWQSTPTFALAPIIILAFGYTMVSALVLMAWGVIWYGISHLAADIQRCKTQWHEQARNLDWSYRQQFLKIYVPALAPGFFLIAKNAWSMMWRTLIAIEILFGAMSGSWGLGSFMNETRQQLLAEETWSTMIVILILGITVNKIFDLLRLRLDWT